MAKPNWSQFLRINTHAPGISAALILLAITQVPVAIKTSAEIACIGEVSHQLWKQTKSHKGVNVIAVRRCNGSQ